MNSDLILFYIAVGIALLIIVLLTLPTLIERKRRGK